MSAKSPISILVDAQGNPISPTNPLPVTQPDALDITELAKSADIQEVRDQLAGQIDVLIQNPDLQVTLTGTPQVAVQFPSTQAVSVAALPLAPNAATADGQAAILAKLDDLTVEVSNPSTAPSVQPISATALPLPAGAATAAKQDAIVAALGSTLVVHQDNPVTSVTVSNLPSTQQVSGAVAITNSVLTVADGGGSLTIDGTVTVDTSTPLAVTVTNPGGAGNASEATLDRVADAVEGVLDVNLTNEIIQVDASLHAVPITDNNGSITVDGTVTANVTFPATQPVSIATAVPVTDNGGSLTVDGSVTATISNFPATQPVSGSVAVSNLPATQAISAASLPLPAGASTAAGVAAVVTALGGTLLVDGSAHTQPVSLSNTSASSVHVTIDNPSSNAGSASETTLATRLADATFTARIPTLGAKAGAGSLSVVPATDASFPVTGTVTASVSNFPATQAISATALPLPAGAATETTLSALNTKTPSLGQATKANSQPVTLASDQGNLAVSVQNASLAVTGTFYQATQPVSAVSLPLPSGAATETTLGTRLADSTFTGRIPTLGAKASAGSVSITPATDASFNTRALTSATDTVTAVISGTPSVNATIVGTPAVSLASTTITGTVNTRALSSATDSVAVSGSITANNASVGATGSAVPASATLVAGTDGTNTKALSVSAAGVLKVDGSAVTQPVSGTFFQATQPVSAASLPLPAGASTETTLSAINTKTPALGQALMAASQPVTIASNQSSLPVTVGNSSIAVTGTFFQATQPVSIASTVTVSGAVTLSGASNAVNATIVGTPAVSLASTTITGNVATTSAQLPATLGAKTTANALAVSIASDQAAIPVTVSGTQTVTGTVAVSSVGGTVSTRALTSATDTVTTVPTGTQAVSGTFWQATQPVSIASSVPVTGTFFQATQPVSSTTLALDATLTGGTQKAVARGGAKGITTASDITSTAEGTDHQALDVQSYHSGVAIDPRSIRALTSADVVTIVPSGTQAVSGSVSVTGTVTTSLASTTITSSALPTGAATETTLASINTKMPALGQALMASSQPVVIASNQSSLPVTVGNFPATQPVSIAATVPVSGTFWQATQPVSLASTTVTNTVAVTAAGLSDGTQVSQLRSGAKGTNTAQLLTSSAQGANNQALDVTLWSGAVAIDPRSIRALTSADVVSINGTVPVSGAFYQATQPVSIAATVPVSGTFWQATQPVSGTVAITSTSAQAITAVQGSATSVANAWPTKITDGTNTAAVKAASTAAVATDPSLVVQISPNQAALPVATHAVTQSGTWTTQIGSSGMGGTAATGLWTRLADPVNGVAAAIKATTPGAGDNALAVMLQPNSAPIKISDGTTTAKVSPASGTAATTDPAIVVAIRPDTSMNFSRGAGSESPLYTNITGGQVYVDQNLSTQPYYTVITDTGGNFVMPTGDAAARPIFVSAAISNAVTASISNATLATTQSGSWSNRLTDGTNTAAVKAASTAPVATDPALVVSVSPNSPALNTRALTSSDIVTVNQGTAAAIGNAWNVRISDGTNVPNVKGSSTASVASDTALVVQISPNTPALATTPSVSAAPVSPTVSTVPGSAASVQLAAANTARKDLVLYNASTAVAYVRFGASSATTSLFTVAMQPNDYYEIPKGPWGCPAHALQCIWSSAVGNMLVTETT